MAEITRDEWIAILREALWGGPLNETYMGVERAADAILARLGDGWRPERGKVYVNITGLTGSGKSAIYGEIAISLKAIGVQVEDFDPSAARYERNLNGGEEYDYLEMYKPTVVLREINISSPPKESA